MPDNADAAGKLTLEEAVAEIESLKGQLSGSDLKVFTQNRDLRQENARLRLEITRLTEECVSQTFSVRSLEKAKIRLEGEISDLNAEKSALLQSKSQLEDKLSKLDSLNSDLNDQLDLHRSQEIHLSQELEKTISSNREELQRLQLEHKETLASTKQTLEQERQQLEVELKAKISAKVNEVAQLESRIEAFKEEFLSQEFVPAASIAKKEGRAYNLLCSELESLLGFPGRTLVEQVFRHCGATADATDPVVLEEAFEALQDTAVKLVHGSEQERELTTVLSTVWQKLGLGASEPAVASASAGADASVAAEAERSAAVEASALEVPEVSEPEVGQASEPGFSDESEPEVAEAPEFEAAGVSEPEAAVTSDTDTVSEGVSEPQAAASLQPEAAEEPEPEVVETPEPEADGAPDLELGKNLESEAVEAPEPDSIEAPDPKVTEVSYASKVDPSPLSPEVESASIQEDSLDPTAQEASELEELLGSNLLEVGSAATEAGGAAGDAGDGGEEDLPEGTAETGFEQAVLYLQARNYEQALPIFQRLRAKAEGENTYLVGEMACLAGLERYEEAYTIGKNLELSSLGDSADVFRESFETVLQGLAGSTKDAVAKKLYLLELARLVQEQEQVLSYLDEAEEILLRTPWDAELNMLQAKYRLSADDDVTEYLLEALAGVGDHPELFTLLEKNFERYPELSTLSKFYQHLLGSSRAEALEAEAQARDLLPVGLSIEEQIEQVDPMEEVLTQVFLEHLIPRIGVRIDVPSEPFEDLLQDSEPAAFVGALRQALRSVDYTLFFDEIDVLSYDGEEHFLLRSSPEPKATLLFGASVEDAAPEELRFLVLRELFSMLRRHSQLAHMAAQLDDALRFTLLQAFLDIHREAAGAEITAALSQRILALQTKATKNGQDGAFRTEIEDLLWAIYQEIKNESVLELADFLYDGQLNKKWLDPLSDSFAASQTGIVVASFAIARDALQPDDFEQLEEKGFSWLYNADNLERFRELRLRLQRLWSAPVKALVGEVEDEG